ncbi:TPA: transcriptional regulator [Candidatus Sumerlaeota bacterium]|jgi:hypothetical protein|nr:transcriptional regulator [Candidatus Sumerlaeota bacterium]
MPEITRFFGIVIYMYYAEHNPPHLHAEYQGAKAVVDFNGNVLQGSLGSRTALRLLREWIDLHALELLDDWEFARTGQEIRKIAPLD